MFKKPTTIVESTALENARSIEEEIAALKRLQRDCFTDIKTVRDRFHASDSMLRAYIKQQNCENSQGVFARVKARVETCLAQNEEKESQRSASGSTNFACTAKQRMKKGQELKVYCDTVFAKGHVLQTVFEAKQGRMFLESGEEVVPVQLRKITHKITNVFESLLGKDRMQVRVNVLGFEGRDAFASLSPLGENASLTGFGTSGASYMSLGDGDSGVSMSVKVNETSTFNVAACAGNNTRVDEPTARVIGQASWRSKKKDDGDDDDDIVNMKTTKKKKKKSVNYAASIGGSVDANEQTIGNVSVAAAVDDIVVSAWVQSDILGGGGSGANSSFSSKQKKNGGGGGQKQDVFEWGVIATKPPSSKLKPNASLKEILSPQNLGWGCVFGHSSAVGGEHVELFARVNGDGFQKPSVAVFPGIVINRDERGKYDTAFGIRAHWYL